MKFQDDISNMNTYIHTYIRTSRNQYVPHFFKVGGIIKKMWGGGGGGGGGGGAIFEPKTLSMFSKKETEKKK